jgi:hypothetical protein
MKTLNDRRIGAGRQVDAAIRDGLPGVRGTPPETLPAPQPRAAGSEVDFRNAEDFGQIDAFGNECEGMCGV